MGPSEVDTTTDVFEEEEEEINQTAIKRSVDCATKTIIKHYVGQVKIKEEGSLVTFLKYV